VNGVVKSEHCQLLSVVGVGVGQGREGCARAEGEPAGEERRRLSEPIGASACD